MELKLIEGSNIQANFEEYEGWLIGSKEHYSKLVIDESITESEIKDFEKTARGFGGEATRINEFRKNVEKEYNKPLQDFISRCNKLKLTSEEIKKTISDKIQFAEDKRIADRSIEIDAAIMFWSEKTGLENNYIKLMVKDEKWWNKSVKLPDISKAVEGQILQLKQQQDNDKLLERMKAERTQTVKMMCETASKELANAVTIDDVRIDIINSTIDEIQAHINVIVEKRVEAENRVKQLAEERRIKAETEQAAKVVEEIKDLPKPVEVVKEVPKNGSVSSKTIVLRFADIPAAKAQGLINYLIENQIQFEKIGG